MAARGQQSGFYRRNDLVVRIGELIAHVPECQLVGITAIKSDRAICGSCRAHLDRDAVGKLDAVGGAALDQLPEDFAVGQIGSQRSPAPSWRRADPARRTAAHRSHRAPMRPYDRSTWRGKSRTPPLPVVLPALRPATTSSSLTRCNGSRVRPVNLVKMGRSSVGQRLAHGGNEQDAPGTPRLALTSTWASRRGSSSASRKVVVGLMPSLP